MTLLQFAKDNLRRKATITTYRDGVVYFWDVLINVFHWEMIRKQTLVDIEVHEGFEFNAKGITFIAHRSFIKGEEKCWNVENKSTGKKAVVKDEAIKKYL